MVKQERNAEMTEQELAARIKIDQDFFNSVLRSDLTPEQKERALKIGRMTMTI